MNILITICGRAGSKGLKNKNAKKLLGIPLIEYTIAAAEIFKEENKNISIDICLNTDSEKLINIGKNKGLDIIYRKKELALDSSPKLPVLIDSLKHMENCKGKIYDYLIDLDITSPLRNIIDIKNALEKCMDNKNLDVVFSVTHSRRNPYFNMIEFRDGGFRKVIESTYTSRQEAPDVYDMNASIYCYRATSLKYVFKKTPFDGEFDIIKMRDTYVLDIDSEEDFENMELLAAKFLDEKIKNKLFKSRENYYEIEK